MASSPISLDARCEKSPGSLSLKSDGLHWLPYSRMASNGTCKPCSPSSLSSDGFFIPMESMVGATIVSKSSDASSLKIFYFDKVPFTTCGINATRYKLRKTEPGFETSDAAQASHDQGLIINPNPNP